MHMISDLHSLQADIASLEEIRLGNLHWGVLKQCQWWSSWTPVDPRPLDRLAGLVVKASAQGAEDPGFESRLQRDFPGRVIQVT